MGTEVEEVRVTISEKIEDGVLAAGEEGFGGRGSERLSIWREAWLDVSRIAEFLDVWRAWRVGRKSFRICSSS